MIELEITEEELYDLISYMECYKDEWEGTSDWKRNKDNYKKLINKLENLKRYIEKYGTFIKPWEDRICACETEWNPP